MFKKKPLYVLMTASLLPAWAVAAPVFDDWKASNGDVTACVANPTSCQVLLVDKGFAQVLFTDTDGKKYIKTIVTDRNSNLDPTIATTSGFGDESYVIMSQNGQSSNLVPTEAPGIMLKSMIRDVNTTGVATTFNAGAEIRTGWAAIAGGAATGQSLVKLSQSQSSPLYNDSFTYDIINDDATKTHVSGKLAIDQNVNLQTGASSTGDKSAFAFRKAEGTAVKAGVWGSSTDNVASLDDPFTGNTLGATGCTLNANLGCAEQSFGPTTPEVTVFWIGQHIQAAAGTATGSDFYQLQVDKDGPGNVNYAYSQNGTAFAKGDLATLGGWADWGSAAGDPEFDTFGPRPTF